MKQKFTHIPLLTFSIVMFLLVISLYGYMHKATSNSVARAGTAIDFVSSEEGNASRAKKLIDVAVSTAQNRSKLNSYFVSSEDIVSFITAIEALGKDSGTTVAITSIDADKLNNAAPGTIGSARAHIEGTGSWKAVMTLIDLAEGMPYVASINHVRLSSNNSELKVKNNWNVAFDLQVATMVPEAAVPLTK